MKFPQSATRHTTEHIRENFKIIKEPFVPHDNHRVEVRTSLTDWLLGVTGEATPAWLSYCDCGWRGNVYSSEIEESQIEAAEHVKQRHSEEVLLSHNHKVWMERGVIVGRFTTILECEDCTPSVRMYVMTASDMIRLQGAWST